MTKHKNVQKKQKPTKDDQTQERGGKQKPTKDDQTQERAEKTKTHEG